MTFKEYLDENNMSLREMGEKSGIDFRVLHRYATGHSRPNLINAYKIYKHTNKKVGLVDWFGEEYDKKCKD